MSPSWKSAYSEWQALIAAREEAIRRANASTKLHSMGAGFISEDTTQGDILNRDRYIEDETAKDAANTAAVEDLAATLAALKTARDQCSSNTAWRYHRNTKTARAKRSARA